MVLKVSVMNCVSPQQSAPMELWLREKLAWKTGVCMLQI